MASLIIENKNKVITNDLQIAKHFYPRLKGLLGRQQMHASEVLWIHQCNSIHTFFMKFSIDAVFVDKELKVKKIVNNLNPWKITLPDFSSSSVFEMPAGLAKKMDIEIGDKLHVGN